MKVLYVLIIAVLASCIMSCNRGFNNPKVQAHMKTWYWTTQMSNHDQGALFNHVRINTKSHTIQAYGAFWDAQRKAVYHADDPICQGDNDDQCDLERLKQYEILFHKHYVINLMHGVEREDPNSLPPWAACLYYAYQEVAETKELSRITSYDIVPVVTPKYQGLYDFYKRQPF